MQIYFIINFQEIAVVFFLYVSVNDPVTYVSSLLIILANDIKVECNKLLLSIFLVL